MVLQHQRLSFRNGWYMGDVGTASRLARDLTIRDAPKSGDLTGVLSWCQQILPRQCLRHENHEPRRGGMLAHQRFTLLYIADS